MNINSFSLANTMAPMSWQRECSSWWLWPPSPSLPSSTTTTTTSTDVDINLHPWQRNERANRKKKNGKYGKRLINHIDASIRNVFAFRLFVYFHAKICTYPFWCASHAVKPSNFEKLTRFAVPFCFFFFFFALLLRFFSPFIRVIHFAGCASVRIIVGVCVCMCVRLAYRTEWGDSHTFHGLSASNTNIKKMKTDEEEVEKRRTGETRQAAKKKRNSLISL